MASVGRWYGRLHCNLRRRTLGVLRIVLVGGLACWSAAAVAGELGRSQPVLTLLHALEHAGAVHPSILAAKARVRVAREAIEQARSGYRPTIQGTADVGLTDNRSRPDRIQDFDGVPRGLGVSISQPVFRGFRTLNAIGRATAEAEAVEEDLRLVEQRVLLNAVTAFADVIREREIVELRAENILILEQFVRAANRRLDVEMGTLTELAQARARKAAAVSLWAAAKARLAIAEADFVNFVRLTPGHLQLGSGLGPYLPDSVGQAIRLADASNPDIRAADLRREAEAFRTRELEGQLLPEVTFEARYQHRFEIDGQIEQQETTQVVGRVSWPLYQGGAARSQIRQSKHSRWSLDRDVADLKRRVRAEVMAAWSDFEAAGAQLAAQRVQIEANRVAFQSIQREEALGRRTLLDVLDARGELIESQIEHLNEERDEVVASATILAAIGKLGGNRQGALLFDRPEPPTVALSRLSWRATVVRVAR